MIGAMRELLGQRLHPQNGGAEAGRGSQLALFGQETRYVSRLYLQRVGLFAAVALTIVLSLDVATNLNAVMSDRSVVSELQGPARLAFYALLRAGYVLPSILPIAVFMGIMWAEYSLAISQERIMIFNCCRAPMFSLVPAVIVGLLFGLLQFAALGYGRPASVEAQGVSNFRYYGPKFRRNSISNPKWIALDRAVVNARIEHGSPVVLHDVVVYWLNRQAQLVTIVSATRVVPASSAGKWVFERGSISDFIPRQNAPDGHEVVHKAKFERLERELSLDTLWVENIEVSGPLLPQSTLAALASGNGGVPKAFSYQTAYQERFAGILYGVAMALAAASLSLMKFSPKMRWDEPLKIGMYWFGVHVSSSILIVLGTYGYVPAVLAAWTIPLVLGSGTVYLVYRRERRCRMMPLDPAVARSI